MWSTDPSPWRKRIHLSGALVFMALCLAMTGCSSVSNLASRFGLGNDRQQTTTASSAKPFAPTFGDVLVASYSAADTLAVSLQSRVGESEGTLLAASFVNINDLEQTSPLGRVMAEQISSRIAQNGFRVLELKLRQNSVYIKENSGEFMLSRELKEISKSHDSDLIIVGTYAVAEKSIYISARIVNAADSTIVTGYDCQLSRNYQTNSLLVNSTPVKEEIPEEEVILSFLEQSLEEKGKP